MATVSVITGLSGSGKTKFLDAMTDVEPFNEGVRTDQPEKFGANLQRFLKVLGSGRDCAVVEIAYIAQHARDELMQLVRKFYPDTVFVWIYFENDIETANWNCLNDPDRTEEQAKGSVRNNNRWTKFYEIPEGVKVLPIFKLPPLKR